MRLRVARLEALETEAKRRPSNVLCLLHLQLACENEEFYTQQRIRAWMTQISYIIFTSSCATAVLLQDVLSIQATIPNEHGG